MTETLEKLVIEVIDGAQRKYDRDNADNYILRCKNAEVLWYQPATLIACVRFIEDKNKNEYHLYNRCHEYLAPGDQVKVYYTTNAAKGVDSRPQWRSELYERVWAKIPRFLRLLRGDRGMLRYHLLLRGGNASAEQGYRDS